MKTRLDRITRHIYNDQFDLAGQLIDSLTDNPDGGPAGHLFRAVLYQSQMKAAESDFLEREFLAALDSLEIDSEALLLRGGDSALAYYYLGHSHAFRSLYKGLSGHTWAAIKSGLAARKAYSKGYDIDSTFHDIALGLGSYRYWKSVKTKLINWTPIFKNEKKAGIELLRRAADSSEISRDAAQSSLIWVYIHEKRYVEALRLSDLMIGKYPQGLTFFWSRGETFFRLKDYRSAIGVYENILDRLRSDPGNYFNIIEAAWYLSRCYRQGLENDPDFGENLVRLQIEIDGLPIPEDIRRRQKKRLREILKKI